MKANELVPDDRELNSAERALLDCLLRRSSRATPYVAQLACTKVLARCGCGCPTIYLGTGVQAAPTMGPTTVVADATGQSPERVRVEVILHVREGKLSELEVYPPDGTEGFTLPAVEALEDVY